MRLKTSEDLEKLYKLFGICAHHCSNIEYSIALLLHPAKWKKYRVNLEYQKQNMQKLGSIEEYSAAMKKFDEILNTAQQEIDKLYEVSLGKLIKQVTDNYPFTEEQKKYLKDILNKRNYVIHKMWGVYGRRLEYPLVVKEMLKELQGFEIYFNSASDWLWKQACLLNGIPEES